MIATAFPVCPLCNSKHDEVIALMMKAEYRRIPDGDIAAERSYVQREAAETNDPEIQASLKHRLAVLTAEETRRRVLATKGGPMYRGQVSISKERIDAAKTAVDIGDLIGCDLDMAWQHGDRTLFYCPAHSSHGAERHPSLVAYESEGRWWCFGCNSGGDAIDWLIARHGLSFRQAVERLERWLS